MVNAVLGDQYYLVNRLNEIERVLRDLSTQPILLNASTGQGGGVPGITIDAKGVHAFDANSKNIVGMLTNDGSITAYDTAGNPVARFGPLTNSSPGNYGIEVKYNGMWAQVGSGNVDWPNITNKPATYAPSAHTHAGGDITSRVASATDAIGSQSGWTNNVGGTSFYQVWVGNDANYSFGRNVSSIRYKENVRSHYTDPANVLALTPVLYDKIPKAPATAPTNEYGLIAEQVAQYCPELVQWFEGQIDSVRYDLLSVALLSVVKHQDAQITALNNAMATLIPSFTPPAASPVAANVPASAAPSPQPAPLAYTIQPQQ
ncbi:hypothetical protein ABH924_000145 [Arthrobacter sp. GAS37]|uniref:tail fiber domain-containing protein n=1 Tax=Arthrobacter sp. GAS37 TaxID=3156261 RepID=UPI003838A4CC